MTTEIFNLAQTFFIDKNFVANATEIVISAVDLWVKAKPVPENNTSGILKPGIFVTIVETIFGTPKIPEGAPIAYTYVDYDSIKSTSDASLPTTFRFEMPIVVATDKEYAIVVKYEGGSIYSLWTSIQGEYLVGTNKISSGPSGRFTGNYFTYVNNGSLIGSNTTPITEEYNRNWRPVSDTDLKFKIYCARFSHNGNLVSSNSTLDVGVTRYSYGPSGTFVDIVNEDFIIPTSRMEFISFDQILSVKETFVGSQLAYQNTFPYPGGRSNSKSAITVSTTIFSKRIIAESNLPNGVSFSWSSLFANSTAEKWLTFVSNTNVNVRKIETILSNTEIDVSEPITFTNASANFLITPIGQIDSFNKGSPFGISESFMLLTHSSANSTVRFVNNTIESTSITDGGSGYSNSDIFYVQGFENVAGKVTGGYKAVANLVTNSSGGITALYFSNVGAGFVNSSSIYTVIANSTSGNTTSNTTSGSAATFTYTIGNTLKTEQRPNNNFRNCKVVDLPLSEIVPFFDIIHPAGTSYDLKLQTKYERVPDANTFSGYTYYIDTSANNNLFTLKLYQRNQLDYDKVPVYLSRSNEFVVHYSNGALNDSISGAFSNAVQFILSPTSNNDFTTVVVNSYPYAQFSKYLINNDYTNEHTDQGNAWAKQITKKINFKTKAEDLRVFLTAYKPANTNLKVYARVYNNSDPEAFDDKDWTLLEQKDGNGLISSSSDTSDFIELSYGFPQYGNVEFTCNGVVTATNNSSNLIGVGTTLSTNLAVGDLIRIYQPLFDDDHVVAVVNAVTNATHLTINSPITNNNLLGVSLKIDKLEYKHQAFNNIMNDNVVRYYNSSMMEFDAYNNMQVKVVMLSSVPNKIPRIDDIRAVRVSI